MSKFHFLRSRRRSRSDVYGCIAGLFGKLHPKANFEEEEDEDENQSNQPRNNKC